MSKKQTAEYFAERYKLKKEYHRAKNKEWMQKRREKYHLIVCKNRAKNKGLPFDLEESDIVIPDKCPYLNVPLTRLPGKQKYNSSVDRIDPNKGYVKGNVEVISDLANRMKQNASKEELISFAKSILDRYKNS